ncbi:FAD-binding and (Fe-S)-binding domain-containing protein [Bradyrhizobium icense]|uniref:FAD-binding and (Fe-S)-binding domain-containing protein n=1 Tax=Bradyrhizobium icense TaxID=1274631 RepID=UPI00202A856C|nr:FAD-linked oxidase C-terminal domain-containing protein [Bradyrhizobium icense]
MDDLRKQAEEHHLTFGPDPATHDRNTLGGMLGNNSCGVHSVMAGRTSDNVESLEILTYDGERMHDGATSEEELARILRAGGRRGEIYKVLVRFRNRYADLIRSRFPDIPRRVSGYENLDQLLPEKGFNLARALVGTEATCVVILSACLTLVESPRARALVVIGFDNVFAAADAVPDVLGFSPIGLEGIDDMLIQFMQRKDLHAEDLKLLPRGEGWLLAEFGGDTVEEAVARARALAEACDAKGRPLRFLNKPELQSRLWTIREAALAATAHVPGMPEAYPGWEDSAVRREELGSYLRDLKALFERHGYSASVYGHFGDGLVHCRIPFALESKTGVRDWQRFLEEATDLVVRYGGSISGEHGDGQARASLLERMYGTELVHAFQEFKAIWDPQNRMNPGKVVAPFSPASNLRIGPDYDPPQVRTAYAYPEDNGSFAGATRRCVGVGKCRRLDSDQGVMCPSYMVTREEKHSTCGRARMLFEMLEGAPVADGWRSDAVEEALNLCLACKGCKSDCPLHVDMATYKSEFRARYYAGRLRPRAAYSMGLIHHWARLAAYAPALANAAM